MAIGIGDNLSKSFAYAKGRLVGNWLDWIILIILCIIPIIGWLLFAGFIIRVFRGGDAKLGEWVKMLVDGILAVIIGIVYMIIPLIVAFIFGAGAILASVNPMDPVTTMNAVSAGIGLVGIIVTIIVAIIFGFMGTMGLVRFAKEDSLGAAFQFGEIFKIIGKIGWLHYILSWIVLGIVMFVIYFIFVLLSVVLIGLLLLVIFGPYLEIVTARYYAQLYETA